MTTLQEITHDSSTTLSDFYSSITDPDGAITVTPTAALGGSTNGLLIDNDAGAAFMDIAESVANVPISGGSGIRFRCRIDISGLSNSGGSDYLCTLEVTGNTDGDTLLQFNIYGDGATGFDLQAKYRRDVVPFLSQLGSNVSISGGDLCLEFRGVRESADGNADGEVEFFVNGISQSSLSNVENFNRFDDFDTVHLYFDSPASLSGSWKYDEYIITDVPGTGLCVAANLGLAPMTKPADIDAAGEFIYLALLDGGTPILTKISTDLDADGTTVFDPGSGDNIGVECGRFNSDVIWVAGQFDGNNVVEKSEDGGSSFTTKDDATIGGVRSFVMGPDSDNKILVFDEDNGDILETKDDGQTWTTINSSVTPEVNAIARLGKNTEESVFGNDGGGSNSINYSVNSGDDLEDYQTGVYPNANATRVVVN
jgi:hypothetical protein